MFFVRITTYQLIYLRYVKQDLWRQCVDSFKQENLEIFIILVTAAWLYQFGAKGNFGIQFLIICISCYMIWSSMLILILYFLHHSRVIYLCFSLINYDGVPWLYCLNCLFPDYDCYPDFCWRDMLLALFCFDFCMWNRTIENQVGVFGVLLVSYDFSVKDSIRNGMKL